MEYVQPERFTPSGRLYAFDLTTLTDVSGGAQAPGGPRSRWCVDGLWVRRKNGRTMVSMGNVSLWCQRLWHGGGATAPESDDPQVVLAYPWDGRYGGSASASWDGLKFWTGDPRPPVSGPRLAFLTAALDGLPSLPAGFAGWWRFDA